VVDIAALSKVWPLAADDRYKSELAVVIADYGDRKGIGVSAMSEAMSRYLESTKATTLSSALLPENVQSTKPIRRIRPINENQDYPRPYESSSTQVIKATSRRRKSGCDNCKEGPGHRQEIVARHGSPEAISTSTKPTGTFEAAGA